MGPAAQARTSLGFRGEKRSKVESLDERYHRFEMPVPYTYAPFGTRHPLSAFSIQRIPYCGRYLAQAKSARPA